MSADNGVYILKTSDNQFRVATFQAVENLCYNELNPDCIELNSLQVVLQYGGVEYTESCDIAMKTAMSILDELIICEYGIQFINTKKSWRTLCKEAQEEAVAICNNKPVSEIYCNYDRLCLIANGEFDKL